MLPFVDQKKMIKVEFFIGEVDGNMVVQKEAIPGNDTFKPYFFQFVRPNYKDNTAIQSKCIKTDLFGQSGRLDPTIFRYETLCRLIRDWSFVDENDKPVVLTVENIDKLDSKIANFMCEEIEKVIYS